MNYYRSQKGSLQIARLNSNSLRKARGGSVINITKHGQEDVSSRPMTGTSADAAPYWAEARHALGRADPILGNLIRAAGGSVLRPRNDPFFSLSRSIVAQQISVHAAEAVWQKLIAHVGAMTPGAVASQTEDALHGCGLSRPKARYLLSLAEHFTEGALDQESWHRMDDDAVIERLVQMKGIGRWTAEMFLIFHLLRPDVLPVADIGIQKAIASHFNDGCREKKKHLDAEGDGYDDGQHAEGKVGVRRVPFELRRRSWRLERIRAHRPRPVSTVPAGHFIMGPISSIC